MIHIQSSKIAIQTGITNCQTNKIEGAHNRECGQCLSSDLKK